MKKIFLLLGIFFLTISSLTAQWEPQAEGLLPSNYSVMNLSIVNDQVVWAVAIDFNQWVPSIPSTHLPKVLRTTNGGADWSSEDFPQATGRMTYGIIGLDENTALLPTSDFDNTHELFKTTNGGDTWNMVDDGPAAGGRLMFFDATEGVSVNPLFEGIAITDDGGESWTLLTPGVDYPAFLPNDGHLNAPTNWDIFGDTAWIGTSLGKLYRSTDKGQNWDVVYETGDITDKFISTAFVDGKNGLAVVGVFNNPPFKLLRTADGGEEWEEINNDANLSEIFAIPCTNSFIGASFYDSLTVWSTDLGTSWEISADGLITWGPTFSSTETGWTAGIEGGGAPAVYKWTGGTLNGRTYVNHAATGNNDGTSWADAYTDLKMAIDSAEAGDEIWVAEGTYLPGSDPTATFLIDKDLKLYGGFAGTECNLSERNIELHPTILSGDVEQNDVPNNFTTNRSDNVMTIIRIFANTSDETLIDGFTITNGHADGTANIQQRSGAGIFSNGATQIKNCIFIQNYAQTSGGGLHLSGSTSRGAVVENCRFETNRADNTFDAGGGMYVGTVTSEGVTVNRCEFIENLGGRGSGLACYNSNLKVSNSQFAGNDNVRQGGGLWFWGEIPSVTIEVDSCTFENNHSSFGGGMYAYLGSGCGVNISNSTFNGNSVTPNDMGWGQGGGGIIIITGEPNTANAFATIENTRFVKNSSTNIGGGMYIVGDANKFDLQLSNCSLQENESETNGGGVFIGSHSQTQGNDFKITNCDFEKNNCRYNGSAMFAYFTGVQDTFALLDSRINENTADSASAAVDFWGTDGGTGTVLVDRCQFEGNSSWWSGALEMGNGWNGGAGIGYTLSRSTFSNNEAREGGALTIWESENSNTEMVIDSCHFDGNYASVRGGAVSVLPYGNHYNAIIKRTVITNNESPIGGAIDSYFWDANLNFPDENSILFENILIAGNISDQAAINLDSIKDLTFLNCTIAGNQAIGIQLSNQSSLTLQNTILANPGYDEYVAVTTDVTVTSLGGNLIGDDSFAAHALTYDLQNTNPLFVGGGDYHLTDDSPAIDKGVDLGNLPEFDLAGNDRVTGCVDIGAYESSVSVNPDCILSALEIIAGDIILYPNPATDFLQIQLPETITQTNKVSLFNPQGKFVRLIALNPAGQVDVHDLPSGMYVLKAVDGERVYVGKFVKQ